MVALETNSLVSTVAVKISSQAAPTRRGEEVFGASQNAPSPEHFHHLTDLEAPWKSSESEALFDLSQSMLCANDISPKHLSKTMTNNGLTSPLSEAAMPFGANTRLTQKNQTKQTKKLKRKNGE